MNRTQQRTANSNAGKWRQACCNSKIRCLVIQFLSRSFETLNFVFHYSPNFVLSVQNCVPMRAKSALAKDFAPSVADFFCPGTFCATWDRNTSCGLTVTRWLLNGCQPRLPILATPVFVLQGSRDCSKLCQPPWRMMTAAANFWICC